MCAMCDCHEVLLSAMQRPAELGMVFKWKSLLLALKHWGDQNAVDKLEQVRGMAYYSAYLIYNLIYIR